MIRTLNRLDMAGDVLDLTGETTDIVLAPGQTVIKKYSAVDYVNLHIINMPGIYNVDVSGDNNSMAAGQTVGRFRPNNSTSNIDIWKFLQHIAVNGNATTGWTHAQTYSATPGFELPGGLIYRMSLNICTIPGGDSLKAEALHGIYTGADNNEKITQINSWWDNASTWGAALGTLVFGEAQSGTVIISRLC